VLAEPADGLPQLGDPCTGRGFRLQNRRPPVIRAERLQRKIAGDRLHEAIGSLSIGLVDDEDIGNLHDACLDRLHVVSGTRHEHQNRHVGRPDDVDFVLANADGLDDHDVLAGGIEDERHVAGRAREPAKVATRRHAADEDPLVLRVDAHAHAIAEECAARKGARRIDGDDPDRPTQTTDLDGQAVDERALAGAGSTGHPNHVSATRARIDLTDQRGARRRFVLDERNRARDGT
jgi:hypothetical protein